MFNRDNLFGGRATQNQGQPSQQQNYSRPQQGTPQGYSQRQDPNQGYGQGIPERRPVGGSGQGRGQMMALRPSKNHGGNQFAFANLVSVSPHDFPSSGNEDFYLLANGRFVVTAKAHPQCPPGEIGLTDPMRLWMSISLGPNEIVQVERYSPFDQGKQVYLGAIDAEVGFAGRRTVETQFDQDELNDVFTKTFQNQVLAPGQMVIMDYKSIPLKFTIQTVQLSDLSMEKGEGAGDKLSDPLARGILTPQTSMSLFKDAKTGINLKASARRPAANSILQPNFKFEDLGIGGLDNEFSMILRKAFASRLFPPGLVQNMGIMHVKGILLYGPPGTGKTLIARRIGQMLNAREPKVINGPEILNKFVGQSEENVRKLFADAEKEYKEKGDESGLHIIIFDELDAVCRQRGSGNAGGTGVGDSIVNQLLSKLDGVDQLNNILLIGMTNRKDMIDEALLRAGRLEVHMEISLPDEKGRVQILNIHTADMRKNHLLDPSVNVEELAHLTKNFSGAEISGLVRAAASFAFSRNTKVGQAVSINNDLSQFQVTRQDFMNALEETHPLFGAAEDELQDRVEGGIMHYSPTVEQILQAGRRDIQAVSQSKAIRSLNTVIYGPPGAGKTALAAQLALDSEAPFIKMITASSMVGYSDLQKVGALDKVFRDSDKSRMSVLVIDGIELLVDWSPLGPRFSNPVLSALKALLQEKPPKERRRLVLATTSERNVLSQLQLLQYFDNQIPVPNVQSPQELGWILRETKAFSSDNEIRNVLQALAESTGQQGGAVNVGIKRILTAIAKAKVSGEVDGGGDQEKAEVFVQLMGQAVAMNDY